MRDFNRISRLGLDFIRVWMDHPDMRFGQLYMNLTGASAGRDVWEIEDDLLAEGLKYYEEHHDFLSVAGEPEREAARTRAHQTSRAARGD